MKQQLHQWGQTLFLLITLATLTQTGAFAQTGRIAGRVTDAKGEALVGATVVLKDSQKGATTDANGNFAITNLAAGKYTIKLSFLGNLARK